MHTRLFPRIYPVVADLARRLARMADRVHDWLARHGFRLLMLILFSWVLLKKDLSVEVNFGAASLFAREGAMPVAEAGAAGVAAPEGVAPGAPVAAAPVASRDQREAYVARFARVARAEMERYGIPASITLAQGLLESQAGTSPLATRHNNHFGIKCFSKTCTRGHCSNYGDDSHKDFFRRYASAWESYRGHSELLRSARYQPLFQLDRRDYRGWARGLARLGYATDPRYGQKLIALIESLNLQRFDA